MSKKMKLSVIIILLIVSSVIRAEGVNTDNDLRNKYGKLYMCKIQFEYSWMSALNEFTRNTKEYYEQIDKLVRQRMNCEK